MKIAMMMKAPEPWIWSIMKRTVKFTGHTGEPHVTELSLM